MASWKGYAAAYIAGGLTVFGLEWWYSAPSVSLTAIRKAIDARDLEKAKSQLVSYLRHSPDDLQAHLMLAGLLTERGEHEGSLKHLSQIQGTCTWALEARFREGKVLRELNRVREAEAAWIECLTIDQSQNPPDMGGIARYATAELLKVYIFQRRRRDAEDLLWNLYRRVPPADRARAMLALLKAQLRQHPREDVMHEVEKFVAADPEDDHSRRELGRLYVEFGEEKRGRELLKTYVDRRPEDLESLAAYVWCLTEQGDLPAAKDVLANLPVDAGRNGELWHLRGVVHELSQEWDDAADCLRHALALEPWRRETHAHLANVLRHLGDRAGTQQHEDRAKELLQIIEKLNKVQETLEATLAMPDAETAFMLADLHEKGGRLEEARAWYVETLRLDVRHAEAKAAIARLGRPTVLLR